MNQEVRLIDLGFGVSIERREDENAVIHNLKSNKEGAGYLGVRFKKCQ